MMLCVCVSVREECVRFIDREASQVASLSVKVTAGKVVNSASTVQATPSVLSAPRRTPQGKAVYVRFVTSSAEQEKVSLDGACVRLVRCVVRTGFWQKSAHKPTKFLIDKHINTTMIGSQTIDLFGRRRDSAKRETISITTHLFVKCFVPKVFANKFDDFQCRLKSRAIQRSSFWQRVVRETDLKFQKKK
jgi:hypothetical protein